MYDQPAYEWHMRYTIPERFLTFSDGITSVNPAYPFSKPLYSANWKARWGAALTQLQTEAQKQTAQAA